MRILVVDDDPDFRTLLRVRSRMEGDLEVVGEAADGDTGVEAWRALQPDVVLMDVRMPGRSGIDAAGAIHAESPRQPVVLMSVDPAGATQPAVDKADLLALLAATRSYSRS